MRFVLDECIDARLVGVFIHLGHDAWTIQQAGLASDDDDQVSVYAADKSAVLVTDDRQLIERRINDLFGKHLEVRGRKRSASGAIKDHLDVAVEKLCAEDAIVVAISVDGCWIRAPKWRREAAP